MKKIIKNPILTFILGTLIFSSITATAYTILVTDRDRIDWNLIKNEIELINSSWAIIMLDFYNAFNENTDVDVFKDFPTIETKIEETTATDSEISSRPNFLERVIGIRTRRRNNNSEQQNHSEVKISANEDSKSMADPDLELSNDDLDIPSFLRRR